MITHRSKVSICKHSNVNNQRLVTVLLDIPYYDLLSWIEDTDGVFSVENKSFKKDYEDASLTPWQPENWVDSKNNTVSFQIGNSIASMWEQLAKATAMGVQALVNSDIHESILQKLLLPYVGRKVLLTFTESNKLLRKLSLDEPSEKTWHLPFITNSDSQYSDHELICLSVYRCSVFGKTAYDMTREQMIKKGQELIDSNSPFCKHIHMSFSGSAFRSNFNGWVSLPEVIKNHLEW